MTYPDSVEFLYALGNEVKTVKLGIEPMQVLLRELNDPQYAFRVIHVAGTNGKGSTCAMIESGLRCAGVRTGLYTSPHLVQPTERIKIAGDQVTTEQFTAAFNIVHQAAERLVKQGDLEHHPTYFETVTAMAFHLFREQRVHTSVVEVGLGGRLDSTNVVRPDVCAFTPIDFDHESYLGNSIEKIASEKAGILKPGAVAVVAAQRAEAAQVLQTLISELNTHAVWTRSFRVDKCAVGPHGSDLRLSTSVRSYNLHCPLAGEHQIENCKTAVAALEVLGVPEQAIIEGIATARWPGRLELIRSNPGLILDGAHNPAGVRVLAEYIRRFYSGRRVWLIYGTMRDKAVDEIGDLLFPLASELIFTAPNVQRAVRPEALLALTDHPRARAAANLQQAIDMTSQAAPEDVIFIAGSLYLVGEARGLLVK